MSDERVLRMLEVIRRKLNADDARVEIGGRPPEDPRAVWVSLAHGTRRLVAWYDEAASRPADAAERLAALVEAFGEIAEASAGEEDSWDPAAYASQALDEELAGLCERTGAIAAVIIDSSSPVVWGASHASLGGPKGAERLVRIADAIERSGHAELSQAARELRERHDPEAARLERLARELDAEPEAVARFVFCARAVRAARQRLRRAPSLAGSLRQLMRDGEFGMVARGLAGVYALVLAFRGSWSEPRVEGSVRRTLGHLERLIAALPPIDPPPGKGRVIALRPSRS